MHSGRYNHKNETLTFQTFSFIIQFYTYFNLYFILTLTSVLNRASWKYWESIGNESRLLGIQKCNRAKHLVLIGYWKYWLGIQNIGRASEMYIPRVQGIQKCQIVLKTQFNQSKYQKYQERIRNVGRVSEIWRDYWKCTKGIAYLKQPNSALVFSRMHFSKKDVLSFLHFFAEMKTGHCIVDFIANKLRIKFDNANFQKLYILLRFNFHLPIYSFAILNKTALT